MKPVGSPATISGKLYQLTAEVRKPLQSNFIPRDVFLQFLREHGEASLRNRVKILSEVYKATLRQVRYLGLSASTAEKLARFLLELPLARAQNNGHFLGNPPSHAQRDCRDDRVVSGNSYANVRPLQT